MLRQLRYCPQVHCGTSSRRLSPGSGGMTEGNLGCTMAKPTDQKTRFSGSSTCCACTSHGASSFPPGFGSMAEVMFWRRQRAERWLSGPSHRYCECTVPLYTRLPTHQHTTSNDLAAATASGVRHVRLALTVPRNQQRPRAPTAAGVPHVRLALTAPRIAYADKGDPRGTPCTLGPGGTHNQQTQYP